MLQPIETTYNGVRFRSRLEARWAVFFDALEIEWEYEFEGYKLDNGECYLPDFWLPRFHYPVGIYAEVKPPGGGFEKAIHFVRSGGGGILCLEGTPCAGPHKLVQPSMETDQIDVIVWPAAFVSKYLPGGRNEDEYRVFWWPAEGDMEDSYVEIASHTARSARFERRAARR